MLLLRVLPRTKTALPKLKELEQTVLGPFCSVNCSRE
uniref:Uncharacterized protein n=1 Tax=Arundo donax TaxID=35708 RepID=A0A0A9HK20_ARUDO